ncbi:hypothetical protein N8D56_18660 [Devosia sp. A8/3-2]|nr:hypothetical protein N8D56_18660 [Devosia sp. A8/3-2]
MAVQDNIGSSAPRTSLLNDPVVRGILYQIIVGGLVVAFFYWIIINTAQNPAAQNKTTGFDFLFRTAGFDISFTLFPGAGLRFTGRLSSPACSIRCWSPLSASSSPRFWASPRA